VFGIKAPMIMVYTGKRAEQVMSGDTIMVVMRSLWFSIVLVAIIPGTAQAKELSIGIKALPGRPTLLIILSKINAARAMYPESSKS
jgi:hypothetical protein